MASHPYFKKKQISIDTVSWTPVVAPMDCSAIFFHDLNLVIGIKTRTDSGDPTTQDHISAGYAESEYTPRFGSAAGARFLSGDTIIFLQADTGTGPIVVTFIA